MDHSVPDKLITRMNRWRKKTKAAQFGGVALDIEKTEYKKKGKNMKRKGGKPPIDFRLVEDFVDFQIALDNEEYDQAVPLFFKLKRIV